MKKLLPLFILVCSCIGYGQVSPENTPELKSKSILDIIPRPKEKTQEVLQAEARINKVTNDAGIAFKQGLQSIQNNRRLEASKYFNMAVEVFFMSGINLTSESNFKAKICYTQLVETIYRIEIPNDDKSPEINSLSKVCGWNIDNQLADSIIPQSKKGQIGFNEQKFEVSVLDELARPIKPEIVVDAGTKPVQQKDGKVPAVMNYFNETFHDPYSMRFIRWSPIVKVYSNSNEYWAVTVRFRAKNTFGAYVLTEETFYIQGNKVVKTQKY
jgi:hypothetical protein